MNYRYLFEGIEEAVQLSGGDYIVPIHFDNGATTPALKEIMDKMREWMKYYGPIGRGTGQKGDWTSKAYENAKEKTLKFFYANTNPNYSVVYTKNATEGINILANILLGQKSDEVIVTRMEHHSNDLPWRNKGTVKYVEVDQNGRLLIDDLEQMLYQGRGRIKCVAVTGASNVTGYINPIYKLASMCHRYGAKIVVDAAQLVAHQEVHMLGMNGDDYIDFLVYSGHKMYAPFGSGAIVGRFLDIPQVNPIVWGGGMVEWVQDYYFKEEEMPKVFEGGTQNVMGVLAMEVAMSRLKMVGFENIKGHERNLKNRLLEGMRSMSNVIIYGDERDTADRLGVITFNIKGKTYMDVATYLAERYGIATRCGKFCAHPYVDRLIRLKGSTFKDLIAYYGEYGMVRISLGLYNTVEEVDEFLNIIELMSIK